jgi:glycosyltransferase involved in cell wall biosynthesis
MDRRILYVQFTDPAAYPPIEHSAVILAERGWNVIVLGTGTLGDLKLELPAHPRIRVLKMGFVPGGWRQKLHYIAFFLWVLYWTLHWRPQWIYASDPLVAPAVWLLRKLTKARVVYHEHDSPSADPPLSELMNKVLAYRERLGRDADLCVLPQCKRLLNFVEETKRLKPTFCVWNCPRIEEIQERLCDQDGELIMYYHGSINRARLPTQVITAASRLSRLVRLQLVGYETERGYVEELTRWASESGAAALIQYRSAMRRRDLLRCAARAHIGMCLMPKHSDDINFRHMVGASNKAFDYMACGLPLVVSDLPEWVSAFVEPGYALACDPDDADSVETALRWFLEHPVERREMGNRGRKKIRHDWNYERMFTAVIVEIEKDKDSFKILSPISKASKWSGSRAKDHQNEASTRHRLVGLDRL